MALLLAVVALGVGLRLARLSAEGPTQFPCGLTSDAPLKDEAAKGFAARSRVLFGAWSASPADDYRFWETLSPVWTWSEYGWFTLAGAGYVSARLHSVLWSAVSMIFLYLALRPFSRRAGLVAAFFFAVNFYTLMFGRMGLLETSMSAWLLMAFACQMRARKNPALFVLAAACWMAAWLVKQSAAVYLPVLIAGFVLDLRRREGPRRSRLLLETAALAAIALAVTGLLLWPDYRIRSVMNLRHGLDYRPDPTFLWMQVNPGRTLEAILYNLGPGLLKGYFAMFPIAGPLALVEIVLILRDLKRRRDPGPARILALVFWLSARAALTLQGQTFPRFYLIQAPSAFILAALALDRLLAAEAAARPTRALTRLAAVLALAALVNLVPWAAWVKQNPRGLMQANAWIESAIGPERAVVVGEWAVPFCFDTGLRAYYLKSVFNRGREQIAALGPTHLLVEQGKEEEGEEMDPAVRRLRKFFPVAYERRREIGRFRAFAGAPDETVTILYRIDIPGPAAAP